MKLIRKLKARKNETGNSPESWGLFKCPYCGKEKERHLSNGKKQKSCGCNLSAFTTKRNTTHGMAHKRIYKIWTGMKHRCKNPKIHCAKYYFNKKIYVCEEWKNDFSIFMKWSLLNGYKNNLVIDRIKSEMGYCPENCRWVTTKINARNNSDVKLSMEIAREIRDIYSVGNITQADIGKQYNITQGHVGHIVNHRLWKESSL